MKKRETTFRSKLHLFLVLLSLPGIPLLAQSIEIDWIELAGNKITVHYSLEDFKPNRQYSINLFSSYDNFASPLTRVTGDVGTDVKPGTDRKITWDITKELGAFKGDLSFEIRGRIFVPFVKLVDFDAGKVFKRGMNYPITWTSGNFSGQVNIELFNEKQERVMGENNLPNSGKYEFYIPVSTPSGPNYRLKFTNSKDRNDIQLSQPFIIKPKVPFLLKAAGVVLVGGGIGLALAGGGKEGNTPVTPPEEPLAEWPGTPP